MTDVWLTSGLTVFTAVDFVECFHSRDQWASFSTKNKRKRLHKNWVQFPEDKLGIPTWLPFRCLGTPTWLPWRHVKKLYIYWTRADTTGLILTMAAWDSYTQTSGNIVVGFRMTSRWPSLYPKIKLISYAEVVLSDGWLDKNLWLLIRWDTSSYPLWNIMSLS